MNGQKLFRVSQANGARVIFALVDGNGHVRQTFIENPVFEFGTAKYAVCRTIEDLWPNAQVTEIGGARMFTTENAPALAGK